MARAPWLLFLAETAVAMACFPLALLTVLLLYLASAVLLVPFSDLELRPFPPGPWSRALSDLIEYGLVDLNQPMIPPWLRPTGLVAFFPLAAILLLLLPGIARRAHGWGRVFCGHLAVAVSLFLWVCTLGRQGTLAGAIWEIWHEQGKSLPLSIGLLVTAILLGGWAVYGALRPLVASGASSWRTLELARWVVLPTALCIGMVAGVGAALLLVVFELALGLPAALRRPVLPENRPGRKGALVILRVFTLVAAVLLGFQPSEEIARPGSSVMMREGRQ